jgi:hypothetical protein
MSETLPFTPEQAAEPSVKVIEGLGIRALQGAISTAERGGFTLSEETEAELRTVFSIDTSQELPLSAHGLGCDDSTENGKRHHAYMAPGYKPAAE